MQHPLNKVTTKELIHNSGEDLYFYMFEGTPLTWRERNVSEEDEKWFDEGIAWIESVLFEDEEYAVMEQHDMYAFTSYGRHINIKKKQFKKLNLQGNSIAGNVTGGAFSMTGLVRAEWGIELEYTDLPWECRKYIFGKNASVRLREWIKDNE